jgi:hypothetical protein
METNQEWMEAKIKANNEKLKSSEKNCGPVKKW